MIKTATQTDGDKKMKANYRIVKADGSIKHAGTDKGSWMTLEMARADVNYTNGEKIYEWYNGERTFEIL